mmetsp:Transcript_74811/g.146360  ORF Transcript_74811/g.146360 Transcript_74811/m.146360 type:complete len:211 (-) Transcript_74811:1647-2279(-)
MRSDKNGKIGSRGRGSRRSNSKNVIGTIESGSGLRIGIGSGSGLRIGGSRKSGRGRSFGGSRRSGSGHRKPRKPSSCESVGRRLPNNAQVMLILRLLLGMLVKPIVQNQLTPHGVLPVVKKAEALPQLLHPSRLAFVLKLVLPSERQTVQTVIRTTVKLLLRNVPAKQKRPRRVAITKAPRQLRRRLLQQNNDEQRRLNSLSAQHVLNAK